MRRGFLVSPPVVGETLYEGGAFGGLVIYEDERERWRRAWIAHRVGNYRWKPSKRRRFRAARG